MSTSLGRELFLTFDVEDFINANSTKALNKILRILKKHGLTGLFFITGHMAEKLVNQKDTICLLQDQRMGFHSSSHSVRPTILEYTDMGDYAAAYLESLRRERSHINPLTGEIEGIGGIDVVRELFPDNFVNAFRAPDYCWSPPHLEALRDLGIEFDFSTRLFPRPTYFKGITFYPYPICHNWTGRSCYTSLLKSLPRRKTIVMNFHHWNFVNECPWNHFYMNENPDHLVVTSSRNQREIARLFSTFDFFIKRLSTLEKANLIEVTPKLKVACSSPAIDKARVLEHCKYLTAWYEANYHYRVSFLCEHARKFFTETFF